MDAKVTADLAEAVDGYPDASRYIDASIDPEVHRDPFPALASLARTAPVVKMEDGRLGGIALPDNFMFAQGGRDVYFTLSFNATRQVTMDAKNFSNELAYGHTIAQTFGETLMSLDAPRHTQLKKLVLPPFSHRIVNEDLVKIAAPVIEETLDRLASKGRGELVALSGQSAPHITLQ